MERQGSSCGPFSEQLFRLAISWLSDQQLASQDGLCSVELVNIQWTCFAAILKLICEQCCHWEAYGWKEVLKFSSTYQTWSWRTMTIEKNMTDILQTMGVLVVVTISHAIWQLRRSQCNVLRCILLLEYKIMVSKKDNIYHLGIRDLISHYFQGLQQPEPLHTTLYIHWLDVALHQNCEADGPVWYLGVITHMRILEW
jgi:hypothetical protein